MLLHQGTWYIWFESYSSPNCSYSVLAFEIKTGCYSNRANLHGFYQSGPQSVFYTQFAFCSPRFIPCPCFIPSPQFLVRVLYLVRILYPVRSQQSAVGSPCFILTDLLTVSESFKVCHIAHCYSKMLKKRQFHWLPGGVRHEI